MGLSPGSGAFPYAQSLEKDPQRHPAGSSPFRLPIRCRIMDTNGCLGARMGVGNDQGNTDAGSEDFRELGRFGGSGIQHKKSHRHHLICVLSITYVKGYFFP